MNEHQATQVRNFLEVFLGRKLLNCWIEPCDEIVIGGCAVCFNFDTISDYSYIQSIAEMQALEFWEKLLTKANEAV